MPSWGANYTYLKLKMLRPNSIITMVSTFSHAFTCDREHFELATTVINSSELPWLRELSTPAVLDCNKPTFSTAFHPRKLRQWGSTPLTLPRWCGSGPSSQPNRNASSSTSYAPTAMSSHGSHLTFQAYRGTSPITHYASSWAQSPPSSAYVASTTKDAGQ